MILEILLGILVIILSFVAFRVHQIYVKIKINSSSIATKKTMLEDYKKFDFSKGDSSVNEVPIETLTKIQTMDGNVHISSENLGESNVSGLTDKIKNLKDK